MSTLHTLHRASGSATYVSPVSSTSTSSLTITCGINFPVEVPRRSDEIPTLLLIDVNIRPARGIGQVRERHIEEIVKRTLCAIILREDWPRMACQVGLQVVSGEDDATQGSYLSLLAGCINAAVLGCLDAAVPMRTVAGAVLVGVRGNPGLEIIVQPGLKERTECRSLHIFAFGRNLGCLLMESEGGCSIEEWEKAEVVARSVILGEEGSSQDGDSMMEDGEGSFEGPNFMKRLKKSVEARVVRDESWSDG
jgi:exosome complex component RRP46